MITLPPPLTIWYRALLALFFLGIFCLWKKYPFRFSIKKDGFTIFFTGILMTIHWVTYFYALAWSNVAVAMLAIFTYPIMTTVLEPMLLKTKIKAIHLISSAMILVGIYFLVPNFDFNDGMTQGLLMGLFSAFCYSIRNIILKTKIEEFNSTTLMFYQMAVMIIILFPILFIFDFQANTVISHLPHLLFLALITTAVGHSLLLNSFKHFSVSTASIMSSMQPIFGIIIAMIILHEYPDWRSIVGGVLILATVVLNSWKKETV